VESFGLKGDEKVLDFGCGPGAASRYIANFMPRIFAIGARKMIILMR